MSIGIEKISFYVPRCYLDLRLLAQERGVDEKKYYEGLGQQKMAVAPPNEDVISMGASAAYQLFESCDRDDIDLVIFCTESSIDQSKAGSIFIHNLLQLPPQCCCIELKQACYSSTAGLHMAYSHVATNPKSKVLVIASDIARYELSSPGEVTQGAGAVAFLISSNPKILEILPHRSFITKDINDFWRPNYSDTAFVDGKYSIKIYQECCVETFKNFKAKFGYGLEDMYRFCFHLPFTKIAEKSYAKLCLNQNVAYDYKKIEKGLEYNTQIGNSYTASLYISLVSLLELDNNLNGGDVIGFFAYGSGCVAEFFVGKVIEGYKDHIYYNEHKRMIESRVAIDFDTYIDYYKAYNAYPTDGSSIQLNKDSGAPFILCKVSNNIRFYEKSENL